MEIFTMILGLTAIYVWVHFAVIQFVRSWRDRSTYEQGITIAALVLFVLFFMGQ